MDETTRAQAVLNNAQRLKADLSETDLAAIVGRKEAEELAKLMA